jgi:hypothetical protein
MPNRGVQGSAVGRSFGGTGRTQEAERSAQKVLNNLNCLLLGRVVVGAWEKPPKAEAVTRGCLACWQGVSLPVLLPLSARSSVPLAPPATPEDRRVVENVTKITQFLLGEGSDMAGRGFGLSAEMLPFLPAVATEILPELSRRLLSRIAARSIRELYAPEYSV